MNWRSRSYLRDNHLVSNKIKTRQQLKRIVDGLRKKRKKIAFTNGCFDILHYGHIKYLEKARRLADILIVAVNSDSSVKKIKGNGRPVNNQFARVGVLSALSLIDYLVIFNEDTPLKLIKLIRPDVLIKGGDWKIKTIVGADIVKSYGGKVVTIPYLKEYSTTGLIEKITNG